jgi:O-antigen/teichoic acid export membrane protein
VSSPHTASTNPALANPPCAPRSIKRRLFASSGKVSLYQCVGVLLGFGFQAFLSRVCGPDALGAVTIFLSWVGILSVLTVPGLEGSLVYFLPRLEGDTPALRRVLRQCLLIAGVASMAVAALAGLAGPRFFTWIGLPDQARAAFCIALIAYSGGKVLDAVFLGFKDAPAQVYFNNIRTVARILFCLPVLFYPAARWDILFGAVTLECVLALFLRFVRLRRRYPELAGIGPTSSGHGPGGGSHEALGAIALPMVGISIIDTLCPLLDKAVLGVMAPLALVGIYRIGDTVATVNSMFVFPFIAFWPYISQLQSQKRIEDLRDSYRTITLVIIAAMIPFSLLLVEASPLVLSIFGPSFVSQGRNVFLVLAFGTAVDAIAGPAGAVLKLTGHARLSLIINTAWLALYLGLSLFLTRHYGIMGAAFAKTISTVFGNLANLTVNRFLLGIFPYTAQHAWMLLAAVALLATRWLLFPAHIGVAGQLFAGFLEASAFIAFSALLLRDQIRRLLVPQLKLWMQKERVSYAAH